MEEGEPSGRVASASWEGMSMRGRLEEWASRLLAAVTPPADYAAALMAVGFAPDTYRGDYPMLANLSAHALAAHYDAVGRGERFSTSFRPPLRVARARIERLKLSLADKDALRLDVAAAELRRMDVYGRDPDQTGALLDPSPSHRPLLVIGDSHAGQYLTEDVLRLSRRLAVPLLCTGASARGLGAATSRAGAGERIRNHLAAHADRIAGVPVILKFGQVDLEFVYDYRRVRDGVRPFDLHDATDFARESVRRYVAFVRDLQARTPARLVVTAALPPALSDAALREGYMNAHIVQLHAETDAAALREGLQRLEMPSWTVRTELARRYNTALAAACAEADLAFHDDFTPMIGSEGRVADELIAWHGGTDHHLCFTSPAARRLAADAVLAITA